MRPLLLILLLLSSPAWAHQTGASSLELTLGPDGQARAELSLPAADLAHYLRADLPGARADAERYLLDSIAIAQESGVCPLGKHSFDWPHDPVGRLHGRLSWTCPRSHGQVHVAYRAMTNDRFGYQHLGIIHASGAPTRHVFDAERGTIRVVVSSEVHERNLAAARASKRWRQRLPLVFLIGIGLLATMTWWWRWPPKPLRGR